MKKIKKLLKRCHRLCGLVSTSTKDQELAYLTYVILYADWNLKVHWFKSANWIERDDCLKYAEKCLRDIRADKLIKTYELSRYIHQVRLYRMLNAYYTVPFYTRIYQIISNFKYKLCSH